MLHDTSLLQRYDDDDDDPVIVVRQEEELYACQRGCRLFSICQFVGDSEDLNQTKAECESSKKQTRHCV